MNLSTQELKHFVQFSYDELTEMNLALKEDRRKRKSHAAFRKELHKKLRDDKRIKAVSVCFTDIEGKFLMLDYNKTHLLDSDDNLTFDGSSISGFTVQKESDLRLQVDWSSFRWLPADVFGAGKVLVFANVYDKDGRPYDSDFRMRLSQLTEEMFEEDGMIANCAPEIEGILLEGVDAEQGYDEKKGFDLVTKGGYFNALPQDPLRKFIDCVAEAQLALGFENEKDHAEVAPSSFELCYKYSDMLHAADNVQLYKLVCRQIAKNMGYTATFLPKPKMNINGSGMHTNISLSQKGKNIFYEADGKYGLSEKAHAFIASILYHAKDICLALSPSVNAYRRLDPHYEAPNEIKVSPSDRGSMIRIPICNERTARVEVRSVAPDCNPYLEMYTLLATGLKGIHASDKELAEYETVFSRREKLPGNIYDALRYFKRSKHVEQIMGAENRAKYAALKEISANRCPRDMGGRVKLGEIVYHHEITNQMLWSKF